MYHLKKLSIMHLFNVIKMVRLIFNASTDFNF